MPPPALLALSWALPVLNIGGMAVFAASGALAAARARQTIVTFAFFAVITGTGGGTLRDVLIGAPVFWLVDSTPLATCLVMALLVWLTPQHIWSPRALDWFDAIGLAVYSVYGVAKALSFGVPMLPAAAMGVVTGCMGGILRDVLAGVPSILLRPEIYVSAGALAAGVFSGLLGLGVDTTPASLVGAGAGFLLRALAITRGWGLPQYGGRDP